MKKLCNILTYLAALAFMLAICTLDGNPVLSIVILMVSGSWLVGYSYLYEENRRMREGR